ncbi:MAG TPA: extensin family protein [Blastocatellia bacterium]|nr:extensin family protein [Blastocatellia bacterium]
MYLYEVGDPQTTPERCKTPKICPTVQNRVTFQQVNGVAIYNFKGNAASVSNVEQGLKDALADFVRDAQALVFGPSGLVLERILWMGAHNCRCISGTDKLSGHAFGRAIDIGGWALRSGGTGSIQNFIYERLVKQGEWNPLFRVGACLHLNFQQVLYWIHNGHHDHFHAEIGRPAPAAYWRFIDMAMSRMLGESLISLGWRRSGGIYAPPSSGKKALINARVAALLEFARRLPPWASDLFNKRFGRSLRQEPGDLSRLFLLTLARGGFQPALQPSPGNTASFPTAPIRPAAPSPTIPVRPAAPHSATPHPSSLGRCPDGPFQWARGTLPKMLRWWNDQDLQRGRVVHVLVGATLREMTPKVFRGAPAEAIAGFCANGGVTENTTECGPNAPHGAACRSQKFHEIGLFGTEAGPRNGPAPNPDPRAEDNSWGKLASNPLVRQLLGGRSASMEHNRWKIQIPDQVAVGLVNIQRHGSVVAAHLDPAIRPDPNKSSSIFFLACCFMGWSAGDGRAAKHLNRFKDILARVPEEKRWGTFLRALAEGINTGHIDLRGLRKHQSVAYSALRTWQKLAAGQLLASKTGGDVKWFDTGLGGDEAAIAETITCAGNAASRPAR